jgi:hypothetical protein
MKVTLQQQVPGLRRHREKRQCQVQCVQGFRRMPGLQKGRGIRAAVESRATPDALSAINS